MTKKALITGITGQDSSYLAELLLSKDYEVHGLIRRSAIGNLKNIEAIKDKISLHYGDMTSDMDLCNLVHDLKPDEIYNLAAQSDVAISFQTPVYTIESTAVGPAKLMEAVRYLSPKSKVYQASSTEMFGSTLPPQNEDSPMVPRSPYGASKLFAYHLCNIYRDAYGLFICNGILGNHESERRGLNFVTRKITHAVARISLGQQYSLELGNLEAKRDWGYAPDYVEAMWLMLQQDKPDNYAIGSGQAHTVKEFLYEAFSYVGLEWEDYVVVSSKYFRPNEVSYLQVDSAKALRELGWKPKVTFRELVRRMVDHDLREAKVVRPG